jgi:SAM-dependent methyltransferase
VTDDREKWDRKYRERRFSETPSQIVQAFWNRAPAGRALDLACGTGRNACFLAAQGFAVDAVDISEVGLRRFVCPPEGIRRICQDLATFVIAPRRYALIINTRFLQRSLFAAIQAGLQPGGLLIFETYLRDARRGADQRFRREHLLRSGELGTAFTDLQTLYYRESDSHQPEAPCRKAALVAQRPPSA